MEAFLGKLSLLDIWDIVLDENKITALWNSCEKHHGNIVAWAQMRQYAHGDVMVIMRINQLQSYFFKLGLSDGILQAIVATFSDLRQSVLSRLPFTRSAIQR